MYIVVSRFMLGLVVRWVWFHDYLEFLGFFCPYSDSVLGVIVVPVI